MCIKSYWYTPSSAEGFAIAINGASGPNVYDFNFRNPIALEKYGPAVSVRIVFENDGIVDGSIGDLFRISSDKIAISEKALQPFRDAVDGNGLFMPIMSDDGRNLTLWMPPVIEESMVTGIEKLSGKPELEDWFKKCAVFREGRVSDLRVFSAAELRGMTAYFSERATRLIVDNGLEGLAFRRAAVSF